MVFYYEVYCRDIRLDAEYGLGERHFAGNLARHVVNFDFWHYVLSFP
jgi:hypothetical protein